MNSKNRMRIICDPFKKEIGYQWYDTNIGDYVEFDPENSELAREKFTKTTIQNRAYEIIATIKSECSVGTVGLEIIFVGTEGDYNYFCNVINAHFKGCNIECIKDEYFFNSAEVVMPRIIDTYSSIKETLEEYREAEITKLINKYNDAVKPSVSLCVMGLYSSGKSAFINSIIGEEVLPSASDPTTGKVCKIYCSNQYQIRFWYEQKECILTFEGESYKPNHNAEVVIIKELQAIVEQDDNNKCDEIFLMNKALETLNKHKDQNKISGIIEIGLPIRRTILPVDKFEFVIYDTPGSNSTSNVNHFEVLKNSLDEQTNALPVFVTNLNSLDAKDNSPILELIKKTGASLDTTNAMVIINKSDREALEDLRKKSENFQESAVTEWKSTRVFFVSSVMGIASKKNNPEKETDWINKGMHEHYEDTKTKYLSNKHELFKLNIIDKSKIHDAIQYSVADNASRLYKNSGLEAVEREIIEYAQKYAKYNKCQQASTYLQGAINLCVENIKKVASELDESIQEADGRLGEKEQELCARLEKNKDVIPSYNAEFQKLMSHIFTIYTENKNLTDEKDSKNRLFNEFQIAWKKIKEKEKSEKQEQKWSFQQIQQYVDKKYNELLKEFSEIANDNIQSFWDKKSDLFKEECRRVVMGSGVLTEEQKKVLLSIVLSKSNIVINQIVYNLRKVGVIRHRSFLGWELKRERFDVKACCDSLVQNFNMLVSKLITWSEAKNEKLFKKWTDDLVAALKDELRSLNPDLSTLNKQISGLRKDKAAKEGCQLVLETRKDLIDDLLDIQGGKIIG